MISIPFILSSLLDKFFFLLFHPLLFNFIEFSYYILCLFFYYAFKTRHRNEPYHVSGHGLGRITRVTQINWIFYRA
jgi:hypothetical protein